jgi:hypothetical protein
VDENDSLPEVRVANAISESSSLIRLGNSSVAQFILGTAPWAGGVGAVLAREAQARQEARVREFLIQVVNQLDKLDRENNDHVDREFLQTDEFAAVMVGIVEETLRTANEERELYLRNFMIASALRRRPDATWVELFQRYLPRLSGAHLAALSLFYDRQRGISATDRLGNKRLKSVPLCLNDFRDSSYGPPLLRVALADLANLGLLVDWRTLSGEKGFQDCYSLTRNGMSFSKFILGEWGVMPGVEPVD